MPTATMHEAMKLVTAVRSLLPSVRSPVLIVHSKKDPVANFANAQHAYDRIGSAEKQLLLTERSRHLLPLDRDWEEIARTNEFIAGQFGSRVITAPLNGLA